MSSGQQPLNSHYARHAFELVLLDESISHPYIRACQNTLLYSSDFPQMKGSSLFLYSIPYSPYSFNMRSFHKAHPHSRLLHLFPSRFLSVLTDGASRMCPVQLLDIFDWSISSV